MKKHEILFITLLAVVAFLCSCGHGHHDADSQTIDSLNERAYALRYVNVDSVTMLSNRVLDLCDGYNDEALNNLAYVAYQQMDYQKVDSLLNLIRKHSHNQIRLLCADIMQMKTTQRTGEGLQFFQARRSAEKRIHRIEEEEDELSPQELQLYVYAVSEMHIIASTYYFYQEQDSLAIAEIDKVKAMDLEHKDPAQWVYYNYMMGPDGLVVEGNEEQRTLTEFDYLITAYMLARRNGYVYFEANTLQTLADMMERHADWITTQRPGAYEMLQAQNMSWADDDLPMAMSNHAVYLFQQYKDLFQTACALRSRGEICFSRGQYAEALDNYAQALACVNRHHRTYYDDKDSLVLFDSLATDKSVEVRWLKDPKIHTVPDWIAGIRQQISVAYSAMGDKQASDYNRNAYLDILLNTNQNEEYEDRMQVLDDQVSSMRIRLGVALLLMLLLFVLAVFYRRVLHKKSRQLEDKLKRLQSGEDIPQELAEQKDECEELDEQLQVAKLHLTDNKRHNVEKRAKVSLVHAIVPYLDRIGGEVIRMQRSGKVEKERQTYIIELVEQIEEYNQILTEWIKMQQGELSLRISTVPLGPLFDIIRRGHFAFDQKGVTLDVATTEAKIKADESLTLFMINTLVDNARKFTPEGGIVSVKTEEANDYVEVQVTDTGCGLSDEDIDTLNNSKVYDPNEIGKEASGQKGFGFGLMNCRGIIEKYKKQSSIFANCAFGVRSKKGEGSTFFFRLPRVLSLLIAFISLSCFANPVELYDSVYQCNVEGRYDQALTYGEKALAEINPAFVLCDTTSAEAPEVGMFLAGDSLDYSTIIGLRNELSLSALALNEWQIYRYNNRVFTRLLKLSNQDATLPGYCKQQEDIQRSSHLLLIFIICFTVAALFMTYKLFLSRQMMAGKDIERQIEEYKQQQMDECLQEKQRLQDGLAKTQYEENRLHVQNQVLDNCLSTIKHESMYYPSRIRQLVENMTDKDIDQLSELVDYYHHIYTLLCSQADDQVEQPGFKRQTIDSDHLSDLMEVARKRQARKSNKELTFTIGDSPSVKMLGDEVLLATLLDSLMNFMYEWTNELKASIRQNDKFVEVSLIDEKNTFSEDELHDMFYPAIQRIPLLIAKQIVREHDTYSGNPGLRLIAESNDGGYAIRFTLLRQ